ncbi:GIY-YIG nuclease family protein [Endozoicomonas sp. Mp262]|uniref:GIY-YIG nuclease family protein n=1 Tax=Endozoicomonas sp. Mp262 TaxID=2919499 RepID=UPI0021D824CB
MKSGFIYILSNDLFMPNLYKIGKTTRDPNFRVKELSSVSGIPVDFHMEFSEWVSDVDLAELQVHLELEEHRASNKEFFKVSLKAARSVVRGVCDRINSKKSIDKKLTSSDAELFRMIEIVKNSRQTYGAYTVDKIKGLIEKSIVESVVVNACYFLAMHYFYEGDFKEALIYFNRVKYKEHFLERGSTGGGDFFYDKGRCYFYLGRLNQASYCFKKSQLELEKEISIAEINVAQGRLAEAIAIYERLKKSKRYSYLECLFDARVGLLKNLGKILSSFHINQHVEVSGVK